jgi:hypothetical protein
VSVAAHLEHREPLVVGPFTIMPFGLRLTS